MPDKSGKLFIVSAPSGAGKTTLIKHLLRRFKTLSYSVSHTTRPPRGAEQDGIDYFFINFDEFEQKISQGQMLEWAKVHDNYYGTSRQFVEDSLAKGESLLLDIDVQGGFQIMESSLEPVCIFIMPPSFEELERRLLGRGTDSADIIEKRLENARQEMAQKNRYNHILLNDDLDRAIEELCDIFKKEMNA
ncbi:MAG: guanylate kinase [Desulfobacula sp.]|nr:guanylate kinase [Desulfobacula sp.]